MHSLHPKYRWGGDCLEKKYLHFSQLDKFSSVSIRICDPFCPSRLMET